MKTIQINLVARIDEDKNNFLDLVYIAYRLKESGFTNFRILFIGAIHKESIYQNILKMAELRGVKEHISFTQKAIPIRELPQDVKDGYFLNYTVGNFMGYSGIESSNLGLKCLFLNGDKALTNEEPKYLNLCNDVQALISLLESICGDHETLGPAILSNNQKICMESILDTSDRDTLLSLLLP